MSCEVDAIKSVRDLPGGWKPEEWKAIGDEEAKTLAESLHPKIVNILKGDKAELENLVDANGYWRDMVCLSWTFRTFHTKQTIVERVPSLLARAGVTDVKAAEEVGIVRLPIEASILRVTVPFTTTNPKADCLAIVKFVRLHSGEIKLFTVTSQLTEVEASPWKDCRNTRPVSKELPEEVDILVVGGGHGGLALGGYLSALNQNFAIIDREKDTGDSWARRYDSAVLHTIRVFSGLPFRPFPDHFPQWVGAKQLATWYKEYAQDLNLPLYQDTCGEKAVFDEEKKIWTVTTSKGVIKTKLLVFAVGVFGRWPNIPNFDGKDRFKGVQLHSSTYTNPQAWKGKKVVIVGSATTGLDVALDCSLLGIDVTVVQRSATRIYAPGHVEAFQAPFYNENSPAVRGDQLTSEDPVALQCHLADFVMTQQTKSYDPKYYEGLKKAGFLGIYDGAIQEQVLVLGGRHYPDIGAGWAICRGEIRIKSDSAISSIDEMGLVFADGSHVDADVIVYCTGFTKDTRGAISQIIGDEYKLEGVWGLDKEGEIRGVFRPTGHDYIWQMGGELYAMRFYGRYLALQLAAFLAGVRPEPVRN